MEIYRNEYFSLLADDSKLFIIVTRPGYDIKNFNNVALDMPTIQLSNFINLKNALQEARGQKIYIGNLRPRVEVLISSDEMEARLRLNITAKELVDNKINVSSEIIAALTNAGVTEGLDNLFQKPITVQKEIVIATGIPPIEGENAKIKYYEIVEKRPIVKEDGSVNHYELNLIDNVKVGDWLGEKIPPTEGKPGKTVTGKIIPAKKGRDLKLKYDHKTIRESEEDGRIVIRAAVDGAVKFDGDKLRIDNHLVVPGDVGFDTGNINFDGYVTIKGIIKDGFSVHAKNDIAVMGNIGIGAVDSIVSEEGSIYIKGGVFGKSTARIEAKKNVYVKYCNECTIVAGQDINVGFYSLDCNLTARKVILDPIHGKIIGGSVSAEFQIVTGVIGNKSEKKTYVNVHGFDRLAIKSEFEGLLERYKEILQQANQVKRQIEVYEYSISGAEYVNSNEYNEYVRRYEKIIDEIRALEEYRKRLQKILETKGEGEIGIFKAAYPETYIEIKNMQRRISAIVSGSFYVQDRELRHNE